MHPECASLRCRVYFQSLELILFYHCCFQQVAEKAHKGEVTGRELDSSRKNKQGVFCFTLLLGKRQHPIQSRHIPFCIAIACIPGQNRHTHHQRRVVFVPIIYRRSFFWRIQTPVVTSQVKAFSNNRRYETKLTARF